MANMKKRIEELELRALNDAVRPGLVQIIGPDGPTAAQEAAEALAIKQGTVVLKILYEDASCAAVAVA